MLLHIKKRNPEKLFITSTKEDADSPKTSLMCFAPIYPVEEFPFEKQVFYHE
jgi:hypothetical protein